MDTNLIVGLTTEQAAEALKKYGLNEISEAGHVSPLLMFLKTLRTNFIVYLLLFAAAVSLFLGESITGGVILIVLILIVSISFVQEYKADEAIKALQDLVVPIASVIRDGKEQQIDVRFIVPGDVVILRSGDRVPADGKILHESALKIDESILTGESAEQTKKASKTTSNQLGTDNQVFMSTFVLNGKCTYTVTHTGMNTRFGKISRLVTSTTKELPLQKKVNTIAGVMVAVALSISVLITIIMLLQARDLSTTTVTHILILAIALAVSAFPEGWFKELLSDMKIEILTHGIRLTLIRL